MATVNVQDSVTPISSSERVVPETTWSKRKPVRSLVYHLFVGIAALLMLYPILWLVGSSFKAPDEIWTNQVALIPNRFFPENYSNGWAGFGGITFTTFYKNSLLYAVTGTVINVAASAVVAYGFARVKFVGKRIWFGIMLGTLMLPTQVQIIPQYIVFSQLGWLNTFLPLLLPRIGGQAFFIFMIVQFIRGIPIDLDEAAMIDGAGKASIFYRIIVPQLTPALITAAIFSFYWTWDEFLIPLIYLNSPDLYTVSLALRTFADPSGQTDWGAIFAMSTLSLVPVFVIFIVFQRYLVQGIATTGLKG
ncbi:MAG: carbohydrate ABC transporter permease [Chloroflexi bacterium]|nr:carbohydrate ABC transporter permease [Chloroflexota bacterium]MCC6897308.1 carbohydrate ABC transporter permease [Anaerolineae bacterium]